MTDPRHELVTELHQEIAEAWNHAPADIGHPVVVVLDTRDPLASSIARETSGDTHGRVLVGAISAALLAVRLAASQPSIATMLRRTLPGVCLVVVVADGGALAGYLPDDSRRLVNEEEARTWLRRASALAAPRRPAKRA